MPRIFSDQAKLDCLKRELRMRRRVYPKLVESGKMRQDEADRQIALVEAMIEDYEAKVREQEPQLFD